jgi:heme-degrading monooxygenase HmoA
MALTLSEEAMYTVIRSYRGAKTLGDELIQRKNDVEQLIAKVPGFIAYYLIKTTDGTASVTVCESKTGCDECTKRMTNWLKKNLPTFKITTPEIISGDLAFRFATYKIGV